ncbi:rhomboid family intramembrane serine protease [Natrarchaeobius chitinivorans]|uniref:Rhomboid family intramembrane serine protease n=1 Tax=Natrarchaeobius chitinivorans TaxID=1679083 RepID=A0A3N6MJ17_NATCH|nr:rhomboid family intramembrane serine protease [Natrarchaeobius chitinivorans]RQG97020.1 rhomboid family intramembrane serine protease [Natrarchaeobius chitinivorans]
MLSAVLAIAVVGVLVGSVAVVTRIDPTGRRLRGIPRKRFVYGVPWGTVVVLTVVVAVYLFVQDGISDLSDPVTIPFRAWSYFYPLGMVTSTVSHASLGHLVGNVIAAIVVAPIAEYAWGHYPNGDRDDQSNDDERVRPANDGDGRSWLETPWIRALVVFPLVVFAVGIFTSLFALGPVIGFSGVVFAFAGFAIVRYPIATLIATIGIQGALVTIYNSVRRPIFVYVAQPRPPSAPSWAEVAIQSHALGFFVGLVLGLVLLERRGVRPSAFRIWIAVLLYAFSKGLWQIYWFGEGNSFLLFRGPGVVVVATLALVITFAVAGPDTIPVPGRVDRALGRIRRSDRPSTSETLLERLSGSGGGRDSHPSIDRLERVREIGTGVESGGRLRRKRADGRKGAVLVVALVLATLTGVAIPANLLVLEGDAHSERPTVEVEEYTVEYVEEAENELVSGIGIDAIEDDAGLTASGVVVSSQERHLWLEAVTSQHLAFSGSERITVGGVGWRETVYVERAGWEPVGNDTVYQVWLWQEGESPRHVYESDPGRVDALIDGSTVTIEPDDGEFLLAVESLETGAVSTAAIPAANESVETGGITFEHDEGTIYATSNGTEVAVASAETYS